MSGIDNNAIASASSSVEQNSSGSNQFDVVLTTGPEDRVPVEAHHTRSPRTSRYTTATRSPDWLNKLGLGAFVGTNAGVLVYMIARDVRDYSEGDDVENNPTFLFPILILPTNIFRQGASEPGELLVPSIFESGAFLYDDVSQLIRTINPPDLKAREMGPLTTQLSEKLTPQVNNETFSRQALGNPFIVYDGSEEGYMAMRRIYGGLAFVGLLASPAAMQSVTNDMKNLPDCTGVGDEQCAELLEQYEDTDNDSQCEDFGLCDDDGSVAGSITTGDSEIGRGITAFELEGQIQNMGDMFNRNLLGVQSLEIDGQPWLGIAIGAGMIPAQWGIAAAAGTDPNPDPNSGNWPLDAENTILPILAFGIGSLEAASTDSQEMLQFYASHNMLLSVGWYGPMATGMIDSVNVSDGNSEVAGMFNGLVPVINNFPALSSGYWLGERLHDFPDLTDAEKVGVIAAPAVSFGVYAGRTIQAMEMSPEVWYDFMISVGVYLVGLMLGATTGHRGFGRAIDGVNEDPNLRSADSGYKKGPQNFRLAMGPASSPIPIQGEEGQRGPNVSVGLGFSFDF